MKCDRCKGKGKILQQRDMHRSEGIIPCPKCGGSGKIKKPR